jgi:PAS domain S-box-containing protein
MVNYHSRCHASNTFHIRLGGRSSFSFGWGRTAQPGDRGMPDHPSSMKASGRNRSHSSLVQENAELRARLQVAEETLRSIREGDVDAVVVSGSKGDRVFTLSEGENLHRKLVETMNEAALAISPNGLLVFCNERACALLERDRKALLGKNLVGLVAPEDAGRLCDLLRTAQAQTADAQLQFVTASGRRLPMHVWASHFTQREGPVICLLATDLSRIEADQHLIVELQRTEEALRQSEALVRAVLDNSPDPIFLKDSHSRLLLANPATFAVIGKPPEACLGKADLEFYDDPATGRAILENDRRIMDSGQLETVEETVIRSEGKSIYLSTKAPFRDAEGRTIGLVGIARDITERKLAEEALRRHTRELAEANEDLARFNRAAVGRELRMIELKKEINDLYQQAGQPPRYRISSEEGHP